MLPSAESLEAALRTTRRIQVDEEEPVKETKKIRVRLGPAHLPSADSYEDDFSVPAEEIKGLEGLSSNTKRRITNDLKKFQQGVGGAAGTKSKIGETANTGYRALDVVQPTYNLDWLAALYEVGGSAHYAAVNVKTANITGLGFTFVESPRTKTKLNDLAEDDEALEKFRNKLSRARDALRDRIDDLNEEDTFTEVLNKVWTDYESMGNGYLEIGRTNRGDIGYIGHIPATSIRIRRKRDGFVQIIGDKATFFRNFGDTNTTDPIGNDRRPNEILHFKNYTPTNTYYGISDIIAAQQAVAGNEFAARYNLEYFENKAVPRHLITLKGASLDSISENHLIEFFETGLKGKNHRSIFIPLPAGTKEEPVEFKIEPIEANKQEHSFGDYKKENRIEILMAHAVPPTKVGAGDGGQLAQARDADKTFKEQVCAPKQQIVEKKLNRIIREFTDIFLIKLNEMTLTDEETQATIDDVYLKNGVITRNEVRSRMGRAGIEKGDEIIDANEKPKENPMNEIRAEGNRSRDTARRTSGTDSRGESRNPKGEGRSTP